VFVPSLGDPDRVPWALIDSPIGQRGTIDVDVCLRVVADLVCGGLAYLQDAGGDHAVIRHAVIRHAVIRHAVIRHSILLEGLECE
jgi:hypothetical protein